MTPNTGCPQLFAGCPHITRPGSKSLSNVSNLRQTTKTIEYGSDYPEPSLCLFPSDTPPPPDGAKEQMCSSSWRGKTTVLV